MQVTLVLAAEQELTADQTAVPPIQLVLGLLLVDHKGNWDLLLPDLWEHLDLNQQMQSDIAYLY